MNHFKDSVPIVLQGKIKALADYVQENFTDLLSNHGEPTGEVMINEIYGVNRSGWIPFQDGGYSVDCFYRCDEDSSYHFTKEQTEYINNISKDLWNLFLTEEEIDESTDYQSLTEEQQESFREYEQDWFQDALVKLLFYVKDEKVIFRFVLNYRDAPYYREKKEETVEEHEVSFESFMKHELSTLAKLITWKWRKAK